MEKGDVWFHFVAPYRGGTQGSSDLFIFLPFGLFRSFMFYFTLPISFEFSYSFKFSSMNFGWMVMFVSLNILYFLYMFVLLGIIFYVWIWNKIYLFSLHVCC